MVLQYESYNKQLGHIKVDVNRSKVSGWDEVEENADKAGDAGQTVSNRPHSYDNHKRYDFANINDRFAWM